MNSRERFNAACEHRQPDRIPIDYVANPETDRKLKKYYGITTEKELLKQLGSDFYYLWCRDISQNESSVPYYKGPKLEYTSTERVCPFGIRFRRGSYASKFAVDEAVSSPLLNITSAAQVLEHRWPKASWFDFSPMRDEAISNRDRVIIGGMWSGIFGDSYRMHGFENFLLNIALDCDLIKTLINRMTEVYLELNDSIFSLLKGLLDVWFFGNDFGSQESLLFSEQMFCDYFIDPITMLCKHAHGYGLKIMMHSCGAIVNIIPHLINAGVDIIDPIQVTAKGMVISDLKQRFGSQIVFHGGIDTQQILPYGSIHEVAEHCSKTIKILGDNGGYVFAPSQILQKDIPLENLDLMYQIAQGTKFLKKNEFKI